ncbi:MAG: type IV secretion system protein VirB3 [Sphingomonadales bacterium]|nr:type IV secretion system protein VirB3 [Sphingomonadales bacterium]
MAQLESDRLFVALTRPQMFAGVTYSFFVINGVLAAELFLILKSLWVLVPALILHGAAALYCLKEPRIIDIWFARSRHCGRVPNHRLWRCNSYRP